MRLTYALRDASRAGFRRDLSRGALQAVPLPGFRLVEAKCTVLAHAAQAAVVHVACPRRANTCRHTCLDTVSPMHVSLMW